MSGRTDTSFDENKESLKESFEESREAVLMEEDSLHSSPQAGGLEATNEVFSDGNSQVSALPEALPVSKTEICQLFCCSDIIKPFHPTDNRTVLSLANNKRNFMTHWYQTYPWRGRYFAAIVGMLKS